MEVSFDVEVSFANSGVHSDNGSWSVTNEPGLTNPSAFFLHSGALLPNNHLKRQTRM